MPTSYGRRVDAQATAEAEEEEEQIVLRIVTVRSDHDRTPFRARVPWTLERHH